MIKVMLLGSLKVDVPLLLNAAQQGLGRNLSATLDARGSDLSSQGSWLTLLAAIKSPNVRPEQVIQSPGRLAAHSFFTFLVIGQPAAFDAIIEEARPPIVWVETAGGVGMGVISGTLEDVRSWIINCSGVISDLPSRTFGNECLAILEAQGFSRMFSDYVKRPQPDKTYKLLEKR